jgi:hypothetical protein
MSLKDLAQQMKAIGRKGDTELVHMTKGEVAGLQALAEAAGGTLTKNPKTGLPEASFLERLLPSIIGLGVGMFAGPMAGAAAGALVGGATNEENPMMGALMGGLGGYGGASLGAGLSQAGAGAIAPTTGATFPIDAGIQSSGAMTTPVYTPSPLVGDVTKQIAPNLVRPEVAATVPATAAPTTFSNMGQGIQALFNNPSDAIKAMGGGMSVAKDMGMGLAPMLMAGMGSRGPSGLPGEKEDTEDLMGRYEYRANPTGGKRPAGSAFTGERTYFEPEYRRMYAAKGGEVKKFADGGEASASSSTANPARGMRGVSADAMNYLYQMDPAQQDGGASAEAMQYLMGQLPATSRVQPAPVQTTPFTPPSRQQLTLPGGGFGGIFGGADNDPMKDYVAIGAGPYAGMYESKTPQYVFDPGSQQFYRTDPVYKQQPFFGGLFDGFGRSFEQNPSLYSGLYAFSEGGITDLAKGGMKAGGFVIPADVVSMVGEGNTDAGYEQIKRMLPGATPIKGKDGGQADTVATSIEGKQPARIAHGEMYVPPAEVKRAGGAKKLYAMMKNVRQQAKGDTAQIKPVDLKKAMA